LGLDLSGGTTITLTAINESGTGAIDQDSLAQARTIIQNRVDSLGVGEVSVTTSGNNQILVSAPNVQGDALVEMVGQTAQLEFRRVYDLAQSVSVAPGEATELPKIPDEVTERPSAPTTDLPEDDAGRLALLTQQLAWVPEEGDEADFADFQCGDVIPQVWDQAFFACPRGTDTAGEAVYKYLLGPRLMEGNVVTDARVTIPQGQLTRVVSLSLNSLGASLFAEATDALSKGTSPQDQFAIVLDGKVISAPVVHEKIPGGNAQISGSFTQETAQNLANILKYGSLPLTFELSNVDTVSASLGGDQLAAGLIAGGIGLLLVLIYCLVYYRALVIVVFSSLLVAGGSVYTLIVLFGESLSFALSLPGLAGVIVAIGITADSFVIFFERIRDEAREGRSLKSAVEVGWERARRTIVIADAVSILSAVILFILSIGAIKGFAFTLGLTTLVDLALIFFFTKPLVSLLVKTKYFGQGKKFSGFEAEHLGLVGTRKPRPRALSTAKEA